MADLGFTALSGGLAAGSALSLATFYGNRVVAGSLVTPSTFTLSTFRGSLVANALAGAQGTAAQTFRGQLVAFSIVSSGDPSTTAARRGNLTDGGVSPVYLDTQIGVDLADAVLLLQFDVEEVLNALLFLDFDVLEAEFGELLPLELSFDVADALQPFTLTFDVLDAGLEEAFVGVAGDIQRPVSEVS